MRASAALLYGCVAVLMMTENDRKEKIMTNEVNDKIFLRDGKIVKNYGSSEIPMSKDEAIEFHLDGYNHETENQTHKFCSDEWNHLPKELSEEMNKSSVYLLRWHISQLKSLDFQRFKFIN